MGQMTEGQTHEQVALFIANCESRAWPSRQGVFEAAESVATIASLL